MIVAECISCCSSCDTFISHSNTRIHIHTYIDYTDTATSAAAVVVATINCVNKYVNVNIFCSK